MRVWTIVLGVCVVSACGGGGQNQSLDMPALVCQLGSRSCDLLVGCADDSGCNWCGCYESGTFHGASAACTERKCIPDLGSSSLQNGKSCATSADCGSGFCLWDAGCTEAHGRCVAADIGQVCGVSGIGGPSGAKTTSLCDCSGKTVATTSPCGVDQKHAYAGACH